MLGSPLAVLVADKSLDGMSMREKIKAIVVLIEKLPFNGRSRPETDQWERLAVPEPKHHFAPGTYAREITIPKGMMLVGQIHKYPQINIMSKGDMDVLTEDGIVRVQSGFHVVSPAGTQRIAFAWEDTVWTTILATEETDPEKIEKHFVVDDDAAYAAFLGIIEHEGDAKCLSA